MWRVSHLGDLRDDIDGDNNWTESEEKTISGTTSEIHYVRGIYLSAMSRDRTGRWH